MRSMLLALALAWSAPAWAQDLVMGVSEGTSGGLDHAQVVTKYQGLADVIGRSIRRKVNVVFAREFAQLEEGMKTRRFDFVLARPSDYPARGIKLYGYRFLASARPDGQCLIIGGKDSGIRKVADLRGKRIVLPEPAAYMTKFCRAELRDQGIDLDSEKVSYVREQVTVGQYLEGGFADVGAIASYSGLAKSWQKVGHTVLHRSVPQPYFPLIASKSVAPRQIEAVQKQLEAIGTLPDGPEVLQSIGIAGFATDGEKRLGGLLAWLEKKPAP